MAIQRTTRLPARVRRIRFNFAERLARTPEDRRCRWMTRDNVRALQENSFPLESLELGR
jgi:hypothetical protein